MIAILLFIWTNMEEANPFDEKKIQFQTFL